MKAIITVKLKRNPQHDPHNKQSGKCPLKENMLCTDITGSHHTYIEEGETRAEIMWKAKHKYGHVTRIEEIAEKHEVIPKEMRDHFNKIKCETGVYISTQISMWKKGFIIRKTKNA